MLKVLTLLLLSLTLAHAQTTCSVFQLKIGSMREMVLADLHHKGCELRLNPPNAGLEDDLVLLPKIEDYAYHEIIFIDGRLKAVWSYSPAFRSAEMAFTAFFGELSVHSYPDLGLDRKNLLGQRNVGKRVFLQNPVRVHHAEKIGVDVDNRTVFLETIEEKDGTSSVRVAVVRNE